MSLYGQKRPVPETLVRQPIVPTGEYMAKTSYFEFLGEIYPKDPFPRFRSEYELRRARSTIKVRLENTAISISFIDEFESFEDIYSETLEFMQAIISVLTLRTGIPTRIVITEWKEIPISPLPGDGVSHPVRGRIYLESRPQPPVPENVFMTGIAEGLRWALDLDSNLFLRRAILDFNYALQHPLNDVPVYLNRAIESAEVYFGGERELINALNVGKKVKLVKRLANESQIHARHAATTRVMRQLELEDVKRAVDATRHVLQVFQIQAMVIRERQEGNT